MIHERTVYHEVLIALRQITKATETRSKRIAAETGLSTAQLVAMQLIYNGNTLTPGELARELRLTQATVTTIITALEARKLLTRSKDEHDRRRVNVALTKAGVTLMSSAPQALQDFLGARFDQLETWEKLQILSVLQRLATLMGASDIDAAPVLDVGALDEH